MFKDLEVEDDAKSSTKAFMSKLQGMDEMKYRDIREI